MVNVAARLQSTAQPGKVLLSDHSARLVSSEFELKDLGKITLAVAPNLDLWIRYNGCGGPLHL